MTATGHALIGTALAASIQSPQIGIPIAILSHVAADAFPHWDTGWRRHEKTFNRFFAESLTDLALSLTLPFILAYFFFPELNFIYLFVMVLAAQLLDWITAPSIFLKWTFFPFDLPYKLQLVFDNPIGLPFGFVGQAIVIFLFLGIAYIT